MSPQFTKVATKSELGPGKIKAININGQKIALCQAGETFYAVGDICSHAKVELHNGQIINNEIECPKHGARFDLTSGQARCPPAVQPIPTYTVEVRGEEIWLSLGE